MDRPDAHARAVSMNPAVVATGNKADYRDIQTLVCNLWHNYKLARLCAHILQSISLALNESNPKWEQNVHTFIHVGGLAAAYRVIQQHPMNDAIAMAVEAIAARFQLLYPAGVQDRTKLEGRRCLQSNLRAMLKSRAAALKAHELVGNGSSFVKTPEGTASSQTMMDMFKLCDIDGDGYITADEFKRVFAVVGGKKAEKLTPMDYTKMFNKIDANHDGVVSFEEFVHLYGHNANPNKALKKLKRAFNIDSRVKQIFKVFDLDKDGYLNLAEVNRLGQMKGKGALSKKDWKDILHYLEPGMTKLAVEGFAKIYKEPQFGNNVAKDYAMAIEWKRRRHEVASMNSLGSSWAA